MQRLLSENGLWMDTRWEGCESERSGKLLVILGNLLADKSYNLSLSDN